MTAAATVIHLTVEVGRLATIATAGSASADNRHTDGEMEKLGDPAWYTHTSTGKGDWVSAGIPLTAEVRALARLARAGLDGRSCGDRLDAGLAAFAIRRHRIGPLVHTAVERGAVGADAEAANILRTAWEANARRRQIGALVSVVIARALSGGGIPFLLFKGEALAVQLYEKPEMRHSGDIDVLVPGDALLAAARALDRVGCKIVDPLFSYPDFALPAVLGLIRDTALFHTKAGQRIELHSRFFFTPAVSDFLQACDPSLRPRRMAGDTVPVPELGPALGLYLLQHGAISGWTRLKWLVDIVSLLERLDYTARARLADMAEACGTAAAVKAGLLLADAAFEGLKLGPLVPWMTEQSGSRAVMRRVNSYAGWLTAPQERSRSPLHDRTSALQSALLLEQTRLAHVRTVVVGTLASGLRIAAKLLPRRPASGGADAAAISKPIS